MKKILAAILAAGSLFQGTALADTLTDLDDVLWEQYTSASVEFTTKFTLDKPLKILAEIQKQEEESNEIYGYSFGDDMVDYKNLAEGLFNSEYNMSMKIDASDDYKKLDMEVLGDIVLPLEFNENLKITGDAKLGIWMSMDFSSEENFKYEITMKTPFSRKYLNFNLAKEIDNFEIIAGNPILNKESINEIQEKTKTLLSRLLKDNAKIEKQGSKYIISFDNNRFIDFMIGYMQGYFSMVEEIINKDVQKMEELDGIDLFAGYEEFDEVVSTLKKMKILGENGIKIEIDTAFGNISDMKVFCDIDMNLYDLFNVFGVDCPEYITKENSDISFGLEYDYKYSDIGNTTVTMPELTDENCHFMFEASEEDVVIPENYYSYLYEEEYFYNSSEGFSLRGLNNIPYIHLRSIMGDYEWYMKRMNGIQNYEDTELNWEDGIITYKDDLDICVFDEIILDTKSNEAFIDGVKIEVKPNMYKHIIVVYGNTYISPEIAKELFGIEVEGYNVGFDKNGMPQNASVEYVYPNPWYKKMVSEI